MGFFYPQCKRIRVDVHFIKLFLRKAVPRTSLNIMNICIVLLKFDVVLTLLLKRYWLIIFLKKITRFFLKFSFLFLFMTIIEKHMISHEDIFVYRNLFVSRIMIFGWVCFYFQVYFRSYLFFKVFFFIFL